MHPHASGSLFYPALGFDEKDMGIPKCVRFNSKKFEDSRVIAAAYDIRVSILAALQRTLGGSVIRTE